MSNENENFIENKSERIIRRPEVEKLTGLSRSSLYSFIKSETFPKAVKLGPRAVGWYEGEVSSWISNRRNQGDE